MAPVTNTELVASRRAVVLAAAAFALPAVNASGSTKTVFAEVWKDPNCGCCKDWIAYLEKHGFKVKVNDTGNDRIRERLGVLPQYGSCHTALIGDYAVEGHVPVKEIKRLLTGSRPRSDWPCRACRSARPAWMGEFMEIARTPTA